MRVFRYKKRTTHRKLTFHVSPFNLSFRRQHDVERTLGTSLRVVCIGEYAVVSRRRYPHMYVVRRVTLEPVSTRRIRIQRGAEPIGVPSGGVLGPEFQLRPGDG